jgi:hypothetical protein
LPADLSAYLAELRQRNPIKELLVIAVTHQVWQDNDAQHLRTRQGLSAGDLTPAQRLNQLLSDHERNAAWQSLAEQRLPYEQRTALRQRRAIEAELDSNVVLPAGSQPARAGTEAYQARQTPAVASVVSATASMLSAVRTELHRRHQLRELVGLSHRKIAADMVKFAEQQFKPPGPKHMATLIRGFLLNDLKVQLGTGGRRGRDSDLSSRKKMIRNSFGN